MRIAVSTLVLAALAVSAPAPACPLGREIDLEQPVLPWSGKRSTFGTLRAPTAHVAKLPKVTLHTAVGDGAAVVNTLSKIDVPCSSGRGDVIVRVDHGTAGVTVLAFDELTAECVRHAIEGVRFTRVADGTLARVTIELR